MKNVVMLSVDMPQRNGDEMDVLQMFE